MSGTDAAPAGDAPLVDLVIEEEAWIGALPDLAGIADRAARLALQGAGLAPDGFEIVLLACGDDRIAALNVDFRGKSMPTNVLSWPAHDLAPEQPGGTPDRPPPGTVMLGDIAIALGVTQGEAEAAARPLKDHALHLILHAVLHLLGYDHDTDADAALMEGIESRQLGSVGLPDPYGEGDAGETRN